MLPNLDEIHDFWTLKLKENYYKVACRVNRLINWFQALGGQKLQLVDDSCNYQNIVFRIQFIFPYPFVHWGGAGPKDPQLSKSLNALNRVFKSG